MMASPRITVTRSGLEKTITAAVQQTSVDCHGFISVYVEHTADDSLGANWRIKGIKYGSALREACDTALEAIVRTLRARYLLEPPRFAGQDLTTVIPDSGAPSQESSPLAAAIKRQRAQRL